MSETARADEDDDDDNKKKNYGRYSFIGNNHYATARTFFSSTRHRRDPSPMITAWSEKEYCETKRQNVARVERRRGAGRKLI